MKWLFLIFLWLLAVLLTVPYFILMFVALLFGEDEGDLLNPLHHAMRMTEKAFG